MADARAFLGEGDLLVDLYDDVSLVWADAWSELGEASKFAIKPNSERLERESRARNKRGQVIASVALTKPAEIEIVLGEVNSQTMRLAFQATASALAQGAGTMVDQAVTAKLDAWVPIGFRNITAAGLTVQDVTDTTTYVLGTDYEINYRLGMLRALSGGGIAGGDVLHIDGGYVAVSGSKYAGAVKPQVRARLLLDGRNLVDGSDVECEVYEAVLSVDSQFDFLGDNWSDVTLKGTLVTPTGKTEPFEVRTPEL